MTAQDDAPNGVTPTAPFRGGARVIRVGVALSALGTVALVLGLLVDRRAALDAEHGAFAACIGDGKAADARAIVLVRRTENKRAVRSGAGVDDRFFPAFVGDQDQAFAAEGQTA